MMITFTSKYRAVIGSLSFFAIIGVMIHRVLGYGLFLSIFFKPKMLFNIIFYFFLMFVVLFVDVNLLNLNILEI